MGEAQDLAKDIKETIQDALDRPKDIQRLNTLLEGALDLIGSALIKVRHIPQVSIPDDMMDAALGDDQDVKEARRLLSRLIVDLKPSGQTEALLDLEQAANAYAARCAEIGFQVRLMLGKALQGREEMRILSWIGFCTGYFVIFCRSFRIISRPSLSNNPQSSTSFSSLSVLNPFLTRSFSPSSSSTPILSTFAVLNKLYIVSEIWPDSYRLTVSVWTPNSSASFAWVHRRFDLAAHSLLPIS